MTCPGRKERVGRAPRAQASPVVVETWCVCNNKTKETCAFVDGNCVLAWVSYRVGFLFLGAVMCLPRKFHQEQLGEKP